MNLMLFDQSEVRSTGRLCIDDERASHLIKVRRVEPGSLVRVGQLGGGIGEAVVEEVVGNTVRLRFEALELVEKVPQIGLVLALPRPQILKKVLQTVATMGLSNLFLVSSERVEKSYFSSPLLESQKLSYYLRLGLEQGIATDMPRVSIHRRFRTFVSEELEIDSRSVCLLAHTRADRALWELGVESRLSEETPVLMAIGPEGGWSDEEADAFCRIGFRAFHCGPRILRVDTAVSALLAQVDLLRRLVV